MARSFSLAGAGLKFLIGAAGGVAIGLVVGAIAAEIRKRTTHDQVNVTLSLLTGYAAFVPADAVGASGILRHVRKRLSGISPRPHAAEEAAQDTAVAGPAGR